MQPSVTAIGDHRSRRANEKEEGRAQFRYCRVPQWDQVGELSPPLFFLVNSRLALSDGHLKY